HLHRQDELAIRIHRPQCQEKWFHRNLACMRRVYAGADFLSHRDRSATYRNSRIPPGFSTAVAGLPERSCVFPSTSVAMNSVRPSGPSATSLYRFTVLKYSFSSESPTTAVPAASS